MKLRGDRHVLRQLLSATAPRERKRPTNGDSRGKGSIRNFAISTGVLDFKRRAFRANTALTTTVCVRARSSPVAVSEMKQRVAVMKVHLLIF